MLGLRRSGRMIRVPGRIGLLQFVHEQIFLPVEGRSAEILVGYFDNFYPTPSVGNTDGLPATARPSFVVTSGSSQRNFCLAVNQVERASARPNACRSAFSVLCPAVPKADDPELRRRLASQAGRSVPAEASGRASAALRARLPTGGFPAGDTCHPMPRRLLARSQSERSRSARQLERSCESGTICFGKS